MYYIDEVLDLKDSLLDILDKGMRKARLTRGQSGFTTLAMVLAILALGAIIITPILVFVITGQRAGEAHEQVANRYYAADTGIQDAMWRISANELPDWMKGTWDTDVYNQDPYTYSLPNAVNGCDVSVKIGAQWLLAGLEVLPNGATPHQEWVTFTNVSSPGHYQIVLSFDQSKNLKFKRVGCWLPPGFEYVAGSSNLEGGQGSDIIPTDPVYAVPTVEEFRGGHTVIWSWTDDKSIEWDVLPGPSDTRKVIEFDYTPGNRDIDWTWAWSVALSNDISVSWSGDVKLFQLESTGTDQSTGHSTTIIAGNMTNQSMGTQMAMYGDYVVTGNTLMRDKYSDSGKVRDTMYTSSPGTVSTIDSGSTVRRVILYWSGWKSTPQDCSSKTAEELNALAANFRVIYVSLKAEFDDGHGTKTYNLGTVRADEWTVLPNGGVTTSPNGWSYSCKADITNMLRNRWGDAFYGNAKYWVGHAETGTPLSIDDVLQGIWGVPGKEILVVGDGGTIIRYDYSTATWSEPMSSDTTRSLKAVWGTGDNWTAGDAVYAAGVKKTVTKYSGSTPSWDRKLYSSSGSTLYSVWGTDENNVFIAGANGYIYKTTNGGANWSSAMTLGSSTSETFRGLWGSGEADKPVWAVGTGGVIYRLAAPSTTSWTKVSSPTTESLYSVWGTSWDDVYAVGATGDSNGTILHYNGVGWAAMNNVPMKTLYGIWGTGGTDWSGGDRIYAVGAEGTILCYDGSSWQTMTSNSQTDLFGVWGSNATDVWAVGALTGKASTIMHYDGASWSQIGGQTPLYDWTTGSLDTEGSNFPLGDTGNLWSYAGWSIVTIYSNPQTLAHQIYLFDTFRYWDNDVDASFDITGFLVPSGIASESEAAKITYFVGEGDNLYNNEYVYLNGHQLNNSQDSATTAGNCFNSTSNSIDSTTVDGVDVDSYYITGSSGWLPADSTEATLRMRTGSDSWNLVYLLLSFRSDIAASGLLTYVVQ